MNVRAAWCVLAALALCGCGRAARTERLQGYIEGEFVYEAAPSSGKLEKLAVSRGDMVEASAGLFALESVAETAARDEARHRLAQAVAALEDARKGKRPTEIESLAAQLGQARDALSLAEKELARQEMLDAAPGVGVKKDLDAARSTRDQSRQRVLQLDADLKTAKLGSRTDQIAGAEAEVKALTAALEKAEWNLSQTRQAAAERALVHDTFYRVGEWIPAGQPVVALLPPGNVKVRFYVPQTKLGGLRLGGKLRVHVDGAASPYDARISYISTREEYTPPVIFSRENRAKLVYLVEGRFDPGVALQLHPGQPVDVEPAP